MNIHLSGQNMEITDAIKQHIHQKFKILSKHFESIIDLHVYMKVEKIEHCVEAKLDVRGTTLFSSARANDMYVAIEQVVQKLDRQVIKYKEKFKDHHMKEVTHHMLDK